MYNFHIYSYNGSNEVFKTAKIKRVYQKNQININKIMEMCTQHSRPEADNLQYEREFYVNAVYLHFRWSEQELVYARGSSEQRGTLIS